MAFLSPTLPFLMILSVLMLAPTPSEALGTRSVGKVLGKLGYEQRFGGKVWQHPTTRHRVHIRHSYAPSYVGGGSFQKGIKRFPGAGMSKSNRAIDVIEMSPLSGHKVAVHEVKHMLNAQRPWELQYRSLLLEEASAMAMMGRRDRMIWAGIQSEFISGDPDFDKVNKLLRRVQRRYGTLAEVIVPHYRGELRGIQGRHRAILELLGKYNIEIRRLIDHVGEGGELVGGHWSYTKVGVRFDAFLHRTGASRIARWDSFLTDPVNYMISAFLLLWFL